MSGYRVVESSREAFAAIDLVGPPGSLSATFLPSLAMLCCSLRDGERELLDLRRGIGAYAERGKTCGIPLLHPWANRLSERRFEVPGTGRRIDLGDGSLVQVEENGLPIHGVRPSLLRFEVERTAADADHADVRAALAFEPAHAAFAAFPFAHRLVLDVRAGGRKVTVKTTLVATGEAAVPFAFGYHPYLRLPGPRVEVAVTIPAGERLVLDERNLPTGAREPAGRRRSALEARAFDDGYAAVEPGGAFAAEGPDGRIEVRMGRGYPFAQVFSPPDAAFACFEPMAAPANALVSGDGLRLVAPGREATAGFAVTVPAGSA
jgi:galactose mutarotase-like enzyme